MGSGKADYDTAQANCVTEGGNLVVTTSDAEQEFVTFLTRFSCQALHVS